MMDPFIGKELQGYRITHKLAEGGMGIVYLGEHVKLGRRAAVKVLKLEYCKDEGVVQRFYQEAQAVNAIRDTGIVDIYDFGRDPDGRVFYVMEYLEGEPLSRRIQRGRMTWTETGAIIADVARALAAAHDKGIVHRDLKPDNIWLQYDPYTGRAKVKVLDFGIAKLVGLDGAQEKLTRTGSIIGTPHYMAPEQIQGRPDIDARADVYALGVIVFEMLAGAPPFGGETLGAILMGHLTQEAPRLGGLAPEQQVPPWVPDVVARMLAKDPAGRPPSMRHVIAELEGGATVVANKVPRRRRRRVWPWMALALLAGGGAAAAVVLVVRGKGTAEPPVVRAAPDAGHVAQPPPKPVIDFDKLRADALALLRDTMRASEPATRVKGADALGEVRDKPSAPSLLDMAGKDPDAEVRAHAAGALGTIGPDAKTRAALAELEKQAASPLKVWLAEAQARGGDAEARARLHTYAESAELPVALKAALALGDVSPPGDAATVARLTALAGREAEIRDPLVSALLLSKLGRLRVERAHKLLLAGLESNDEQARLACAEGLARIGDDSGKKVLLDILADAASRNRLVAASVLVSLGDDTGYPLFLDKIGDPDAATRRLAARGLGLVGERDSVTKLADGMADKEAAVRIAAAAAVLAIVAVDPKLLAQASVDWTKSALAAEDWATRESAAALVGVVPEREGIPLLAQALTDPQPEVRKAAAKSARRLKSRNAARTLAAAAPREADAGVKEEIARSLGGSRAPEARVALGELAKEPGAVGAAASSALLGAGDAGARARVEAALADPKPEVRRAALEAAAAAPTAAFAPLLQNALSDKVGELRLLAAEVLARLGTKSPEAVAVLKAALAEKDAGVRARATGALVRLGESLDGLDAPTPRELLQDPDASVRRASLAIIGAMPAAEALPLLRRALLDADVDTRKAALDALLAFSAADTDGVSRLHRLALRDPDPAVRAQAQAQLAGLLQPAPPEPEAATDLAALTAAADELAAAVKEAVDIKARAEKCATDVDAAAGGAARDEAAIKVMEGLVHACVEVASQSQVVRGRVDAALARAEIAAGDKPPAEAAQALETARKTAREARPIIDGAGSRAEEAARRGRSWIQNETGDATTFIAAAEAALAAGNLGEARRALERADKLLRAARKDTAPVKYGFAQLYDRQAGREKQPAAKLALLKKAKASYDEFAARGSGPRVAAAKERSQELADEIRDMGGTP